MKKVQIPEINKFEINWNKKQWVQAINDPNQIVLTAGGHDGDTFEGTCLPCEKITMGGFDTCWSKERFKVLTDDITFIISNKED